MTPNDFSGLPDANMNVPGDPDYVEDQLTQEFAQAYGGYNRNTGSATSSAPNLEYAIDMQGYTSGPAANRPHFAGPHTPTAFPWGPLHGYIPVPKQNETLMNGLPAAGQDTALMALETRLRDDLQLKLAGLRDDLQLEMARLRGDITTDLARTLSQPIAQGMRMHVANNNNLLARFQLVQAERDNLQAQLDQLRGAAAAAQNVQADDDATDDDIHEEPDKDTEEAQTAPSKPTKKPVALIYFHFHRLDPKKRTWSVEKTLGPRSANSTSALDIVKMGERITQARGYPDKAAFSYQFSVQDLTEENTFHIAEEADIKLWLGEIRPIGGDWVVKAFAYKIGQGEHLDKQLLA